MRNVQNGARRCKGTFFALPQSTLKTFIFPFAALLLVLASCTKDAKPLQEDHEQHMKAIGNNNERNPVHLYTGLSFQTVWELQQARAATAKYKNIKNAFKDGYVNIDVAAENMGHHFMRTDLVDATFDYRSPEILVYNKDEKGNYYLVAVEYAVPIDLLRPEGFTGSADAWDNTSPFPFWLLHAWVWAYNPQGVFNPTNPLVHLHE